MKPAAIMALVMASLAFGSEKQFDRLVHAIETHYGTHRTNIPLMGVANFFVKVAHPEGASSFKLAIFENLKTADHDWAERDRFIESFSDGLHPLVRVHSSASSESTYILAGPVGKSTEMLIATFEAGEATVIQVRVDTSTLLESIQDPQHAGNRLRAREEP